MMIVQYIKYKSLVIRRCVFVPRTSKWRSKIFNSEGTN